MLNLYTVVVDTGTVTDQRTPVRARNTDEAMDQALVLLKIPYQKVVTITAWEVPDGSR